MNVQLFIPCFIDQLFPQVGFNMVKVLQKVGCTVHYNTEQTCCGQPAFNAGFRGEAKEVCSKFVKDFAGNDFIVAPSASCIGFVKNYYPSLFNNTSLHNQVKALSEKVFELSDFLVNVLGVEDLGASFPAKVTYHDSCAALRECNIKQEPRKLLSHVHGLQLVEMNDVETCCGFGGTFAVKFEPISAAMGDQKIVNALATEAEYIISTDMSCLMHLQGIINFQQKPIQVMHLADVLASGW
ncbi:(Fe-S)-binding protein [Hydrotalea sp.]|uniref:(Fe-S)-binding protein n=1 Tax=Hydrotalea sp. TaxID=2881279 RepID=UPI003D0C6167